MNIIWKYRRALAIIVGLTMKDRRKVALCALQGVSVAYKLEITPYRVMSAPYHNLLVQQCYIHDDRGIGP